MLFFSYASLLAELILHYICFAEEKTLGAVFDDYSDPDAPPLTQLPPKHLLYYNLGIKMPGESIDEEPTPRGDDDDEDKPTQDDDDPELIQELSDDKQKVKISRKSTRLRTEEMLIYNSIN